MKNSQLIEKLETLRKEINERWNLTAKFGGEWNAGYTDGLSYASSLVNTLVQELKREANKNESRILDKYSHGPKPSNCGNDCKCR